MAAKFQPTIALTLPTPVAATPTGVADAAATQLAGAIVLALFDECAPGVRRYLWSFGLDGETAEDVLQEVFLSLFRHLCLGRPQTNLKGWLFQVAHNLALKQRQKRWRLRQREHRWDEALNDRLIDPAAGPEDLLRERQRRDRLSSVLRAVSERDRRSFLLRAEGLTYREIADTLGISLGSVAKSLARVISRLTTADTE